MSSNRRPVWDDPKPHIGKDESVWLALRRLDSDWQAKRARETGSQVGISIAVSYGVTALFTYNKDAPVQNLPNLANDHLAAVQLTMSLVSVLLFVLARRSSNVILAAFLFAWSVSEFIPPLTRPIFGHTAYLFLAAMSTCLSILYLRGVLYARRTAMQPSV